MREKDSSNIPEYLYDRVDKAPQFVDRDIRRLIDLENQYQGLGLNSPESTERDNLIQEYGLEYHEVHKLRFMET
jgi:hypothetical protein